MFKLFWKFRIMGFGVFFVVLTFIKKTLPPEHENQKNKA